MKKFFGFARRKSSSSLKGINPRRFSIGSSASSTTLQIQVIHGGYNVDLEKVDASFTKLHKAALLNDEERVRKQLKNFDANSRDSSGRTPLHLATVNGNLNIIRLLIESGANVNCQDADGKTPLFKSIECQHDDLVQFFLFANADPQLSDYENGNTPLHWSLSCGNLRAAQYLIRNAIKLDVNKRNNQSETCLHIAVKLPQLCILLEELIAKGCHIDAKDDRGKTPLMIAQANDNTNAVTILLKHGARPCHNDERVLKNGHESPSAVSLSMAMKQHTSHSKTDDADSWPDTDEEEDSNYDHPKRRDDKDRESPCSLASKPRKESFKRVSSLVDETIVEEYKVDTEDSADEDARCKPSASSHSHQVTDRHEQHIDPSITGKLIWNDTETEDDTTEDVTKKSESGTLGKADTMHGGEELWTSNATVKTHDKQIDNKMAKRSSSGDVMEDIEALLREDPSHDKNIDFIEQIKNLLEEEEPKPRVSQVIPPPPPPPPPTAEEVKPLSEIRRRSYAEVVAQSKGPQQEVIDELKVAISSRAKSYADVVISPKHTENGKAMGMSKNSSPKKSKINQKVNDKIIIDKRNTSPQYNGKTSKIPMPSKVSDKQLKIMTNGSTPVKDNLKNNINNNKTTAAITATTSEESLSSDDPELILTVETHEVNRHHQNHHDIQKIILQSASDTTQNVFDSSDNRKNGAMNYNDLQRTVMQLRIDLEKERNSKSLLMTEHELIKEQLNQLRIRSQEESMEKLQLEKRLIQIEGQLQQYQFTIDMRIKEINGLRIELNEMRNHTEGLFSEKHHLEMDNQKLQNQIKLMMSDKEIREKEIMMQSMPLKSTDESQSQIMTDFRAKIDQLIEENRHLRDEHDRYKKTSINREMDFEKEKIEDQMRIMESLNRTHQEQELLSKSSVITREEHRDLVTSIRELNHLMTKLDDRITRTEESQQQRARTFNEEMFDYARNLLDQIRVELNNFKKMLTDTAVNQRDNRTKSSPSGDNHLMEDNPTEKQLSAFETRIAELRSSLERLEDQIQTQELQLIGHSDIISLTPLRKSSSTRELFISPVSGNKPKSWFVQTLFRLQPHIHSQTPIGDSISAFAHQKSRLQKQIHDLKSELGLFAESVH